MKRDHTIDEITTALNLYAQLKRETGAEGVDRTVEEAIHALGTAIGKIRALPVEPGLQAREPDGLSSIQALRPAGHRRIGGPPSDDAYHDRLSGSFLGRSAGCVLGAPVEGWSIERMKRWAGSIGDPFPCVDYWSRVPDPSAIRYLTTPASAYTSKEIKGIPVDDDLVYTFLGLLILEEHGPDFTVDDVSRSWLQHLPFACTAEDVALANLEIGVSAEDAASSGGPWAVERAVHMGNPHMLHDGPVDNPYIQWIGAGIRADPWGYVAPGWPERAAELAYRDATLSHRRNGIYGEMYFAAAIAAAFVVDDPVEALRIGLEEIPARCMLADAINWALERAPEIRTYQDAHDAVSDRYPAMSIAHTVNNACLTVWGITIGGTDFTRVIGETVAMGYDNDCTAATAGSIVGAVVGKEALPDHWIRPFGDRLYTYVKSMPEVRISDMLARFARQKDRMLADT